MTPATQSRACTRRARQIALAAVVSSVCIAAPTRAQQPAPPEAKPWTAQDDHKNMLEQLGIKALRPGPSGNDTAANHANYDETKANPFPQLPDVLTLKNGKKVTTAKLWSRRRAEIVEDFEREVYGRIPKHVPKVTWTVTATDTGTLAGRRVVGQQLTGHVDNTAYPAITVDISLTLVLPEHAKAAPVMILFGGRPLAQAVGRPAPPPPAGSRAFVFPPPPPGSDAPNTEQLIVDGWGFAFVSPGSIQADNGAGLTKGIIGLVNKGQPRKPDDWGALRAWAWGAGRALDYLETEKRVNAKQVGIEGVSRYGKAALVTMAFDERFAVVLIGSSGEGGAKLHRRNWGEAVENLTGSGEYHWMAGNFLKYGASDATFGSRNAGDLPVDAHELLALCAPRLTFVSYGVPEKGDAKWLDHQGSFMAAIASQPVFRLLGAKDLGRSDDYLVEKMPPVNVGLVDGQLAWRQHDGGHTDAPNWKYFLTWADRFFKRAYTPAPPVVATAAQGQSQPAPMASWPADRPTPRTDSNSMLAHRQLLEKRSKGKIDVYFMGNSITRRWGATDYPQMLANWNANFFGWNAADFGWGADRIEHMLWRVENGELDGVNPKVIVVLAGTNNVGARPGDDAKVADITRGIKALIDLCRKKAPNATVIVTGIFPRNDNIAVVPEINRINENIARFADGKAIRYVNINDKLADKDGVLFDGMTVDKLHPTVKGYQIWADALKPILTELLGPPAATDQAPPPTGDPSAQKPPVRSPSRLRLAHVFSDGVVLQRNAPLAVWGWAPPGAGVTVELAGRRASSVASSQGTWRVTLPALVAGGPHVMDVMSGVERRRVTDVLVGDVWLAGGQSNMEWKLADATDGARETSQAHDSALRNFRVPIAWADSALSDGAAAQWTPANPKHAGDFSAVAYLFAKEMRAATHVPVGIVDVSWGGSAIETWLSREASGLDARGWDSVITREHDFQKANRDTLMRRIGGLPTEDAGLVNGRALWADPAFDDATWETIRVPGAWERNGYPGLDGVAWYRVSVVLSAAEAAGNATLSLGAIDDEDVTWVNGAEVGRTAGYATPRVYRVPSGILREGRNTIAIRVTDGGGDGGLTGPPADLVLTVDGRRRMLVGPWKFKVAVAALGADQQHINKIPTVGFNAMVNPLRAFPIRGVIWYQGESNANTVAQATAYRAQFATLIQAWRGELAGSTRDFPFLWVQLPNFGMPDSTPPYEAGWATLRASQHAALALPHTGEAVSIDVGDSANIHPRDKRMVAHRLALAARETSYGERIAWQGPTYLRHAVAGNTITIEFSHASGGFRVVGGARRVRGFAVAGDDRRWYWADARVVGSRVVVSSAAVPHPVAVRYAWSNGPVGLNLYGATGLPAVPFRTDRW